MTKDVTPIGDEFQEIKEVAPDTKIAPAVGVAAIALSMALKYHGMQMIPDGLTYQQYKMEGRNITTLGLHDVFETAIKIELHLLAGSERIAQIVVEAIEHMPEEDEPENLAEDPE